MIFFLFFISNKPPTNLMASNVSVAVVAALPLSRKEANLMVNSD